MRQRTLSREIVGFCHLLKKMDINVTTTNQIGFCRSLEFIDIGQRDEFYHTARTNLIANESDRETFDLAFDLFWKYPRPALDQLRPDDDGTDGPSTDESSLRELADLVQDDDGDFAVNEWLETNNEENEDQSAGDTIAYSPDDVLTQKDFSKLSPEEIEKARKAIAKFAALLATKLSRRKEPATKGKTIDFRRSWRRNIAYGGETISLIHRRRKIKKNKILLLCDVSGSMDCYSKFLIQFIYGMQKEIREIEIAVFSTRLTNITGLLRRKGVEDGLREIAEVVPDWSGGTKIGESVIGFYREFARSFSANRSVVILISDGWDQGDADVLRRSMELLNRHAYKLIWLNPLLGSSGYQPVCRGIRTALPYVDYFLPAHNLESLVKLTKVLIPIWSH
ncbi:MAG: VWA domain-containing protein [Candidatus Poribacteria bacterium]|nr:VWA domain-containing protein [Candidatus Poribacteria bacterium]MDE0504626.1 VWA domain-containing protein [Candidatus Poribacteria bacterium]